MTYFVYENWKNPKAMVHFADCYCCKYGKGQFGGTKPENGRWSKEFTSFEDALDFAKRSPMPEMRCKKCKPK